MNFRIATDIMLLRFWGTQLSDHVVISDTPGCSETTFFKIEIKALARSLPDRPEVLSSQIEQYPCLLRESCAVRLYRDNFLL